MSTALALTDFIQLEPNIWYLKPPGSDKTTKLIITCGWMNGKLRSIASYARRYRNMYPEAAMVAITNDTGDVVYRPTATQDKRLMSVLGIVASSQSFRLHLFSNGGANQAVRMARLYRHHYGKALPLHAMTLDSCPGYPDFESAYTAFRLSLPDYTPIYLFGSVVMYLWLSMFFVIAKLIPSLHVLRDMRKDLNDPMLFPLSAPRLYIYSKNDVMVAWAAVEHHARDGREIGYKVDTQLFTSSTHVNHVVQESNRYWHLVQYLDKIRPEF
jgi:uncharacterized protein DUF829